LRSLGGVCASLGDQTSPSMMILEVSHHPLPSGQSSVRVSW